jgi:hypothetical protein
MNVNTISANKQQYSKQETNYEGTNMGGTAK